MVARTPSLSAVEHPKMPDAKLPDNNATDEGTAPMPGVGRETSKAKTGEKDIQIEIEIEQSKTETLF